MIQKKHSCSFCQTKGHTIKTCLLRLKQIKDLEKINAASRIEFVELLDRCGFYINSLIELKYRDFSSIFSSRDVDVGMGLFFVKQIRWESVNKSLISQNCSQPIRTYLSYRDAITTNYANVTLHSPEYPGGFGLTVTNDKLKHSLQKTNFSIETALLGEFIVHDIGDKEETLNNIPDSFFDGKFYNSLKKIIK